MRTRRPLAVALIAGALIVLCCCCGAAGSAARPRPAGGRTLVGASTTADAAPAAVSARPFYAYFYQWFNASSWRRAKQDYPSAGSYSSDDPHVLRDQVQQAKQVGLDGFLTSWKDTKPLDRRLDLLLGVARDEQFDVGVVYEALDFSRKPLPIANVRADLQYLVNRWSTELTSRYFGRPLIIWTGTDRYSLDDVRSVRAALAGRAYLLAASKQVSGYERVASAVDGEAYYWSSADPAAASTAQKLTAMSTAVHAHHGLWIAPAAPGFDGRPLGHTRVIDRKNGTTLLRSLEDAAVSDPDAVGVISWNEWSENTYIEPGRRYGRRELDILQAYLSSHAGHRSAPSVTDARNRPLVGWSGLEAALGLAVITGAGALVLALRARRRLRGRPRAGPPAGPPSGPPSGPPGLRARHARPT